ncbi:unnamed protein product [Urochloa humidicola]
MVSTSDGNASICRIVGHEDERCNGFSNLDLNCAPISEVEDLKNVPGGNITGCLRLGVSTESVTRESGSSSPPISRDVLVFDLNADAAMDITPYSEKDAEGVAADVGSIGKNGVGQTSVIGSSSEVGILAIRNGNADDLGMSNGGTGSESRSGLIQSSSSPARSGNVTTSCTS